jgi:hypothetical protein
VTEPEKKGGPIVPTRTPKKKTPGIFDNLRPLMQPHPVEEILGLTPISARSTPSSPSTDSTPSTDSISAERQNKLVQSSAISPQRDYTKVANSIVRAVPDGIFGDNGGKSKQLYDYLYTQTRGAIVPSRTVRVPKGKLMKAAGIGSEITLRKNLQRLRDTGLLKESIVAGTHGGNEYEVFTPEEVRQTAARASTPSTPSNPPQLREALPLLEATGSSPSSSLINAITYGEPKTSFKTTEKPDDEAFAEFIRVMQAAFVEVSTQRATGSDAERLRELAELLTAELKLAAALTSVTSGPAFLTEHLRRRLLRRASRSVQDKQQATPAPTGDQAGLDVPGAETEEYSIDFHVEMFAGLLRDGAYTMETLKDQFAAAFDPEQWEHIEAEVSQRRGREQ